MSTGIFGCQERGRGEGKGGREGRRREGGRVGEEGREKPFFSFIEHCSINQKGKKYLSCGVCVCVYVICMFLLVCACRFMCLYVHMCVWWPEVNVGLPPSILLRKNRT